MGFCLEVSGDFACFTRPEMKVERVSYDVITPSAARSIFDAILWKPAIEWQVTKIEVLNPIRWINLRRNEIKGVISASNVRSAMKAGCGTLGFYVDDGDNRQQRAGLFLRDVSYRIHAEFSLTQAAGAADLTGKYAEMFRRRAKKGQCFNQPYLGCREFSCDFSLVEEGADLKSPIDDTRDLGWMMYDMDYTDLKSPTPLFFRAEIKNGVVLVPSKNSAEVRG